MAETDSLWEWWYRTGRKLRPPDVRESLALSIRGHRTKASASRFERLE